MNPRSIRHKAGRARQQGAALYVALIMLILLALIGIVGMQVADSDSFAGIEPGVPCESEKTLYPSLNAARAGAVRVHICEAHFLDIGTPDDYLRTSLVVGRSENISCHGNRVRIHATARVADSVLWDDVEVCAGATLDECIVTDGVRVPEGTTCKRVTMRVA